MLIALEIAAAVLTAAAVIFISWRVYRKFRPLPLINLTITRVRTSFHTTYNVRCLICSAETEIEISRDSVVRILRCPICGEGGPLRRVQESMRRRILLKKEQEQRAEADRLAAERRAHEEAREGGRKLDL